METKEIEVRFLEINKEELLKKLAKLGAIDCGEVMLEEIIIYDSELKWREERKFLRLRKSGDTTILTYKQNKEQSIDGAREVELEVGDFKKAEFLLEKIGFVLFRRQQKKRHTLKLNDVTVDIDTWPRIPAYVELEGPGEDSLRKAAEMLGLSWDKVVVQSAGVIIEKIYKIPVGTMRWFTFDRFE